MNLDIERRKQCSRLARSGATHCLHKGTPQPADALEQRIAEMMQAYDAQGNHRTGTAVDNASAEWLVRLARQAGADASLEPFSLSRVDPEACCLLTVDRRIHGVRF